MSVDQAKTTQTGGPRVFISYGRADADAADQIHTALETRGVSTWMDTKDLRPGSAWLTAIETAAQSVQSALILIGQNQLSPWQRGELEALLVLEREKHLQIIPTLLPGAAVKPEQLPLMLRRFQVVDFRRGFDDSGLDALAAGIRGQAAFALPVGAKPTPRRWSRRWLWVAAASAVVITGVTLGAILQKQNTPSVALEKAERPREPAPERPRPPAPEPATKTRVVPSAQPVAKEEQPDKKKISAPIRPARSPAFLPPEGDRRPILIIQRFDVPDGSPEVRALERLLPNKIAAALQDSGCLVVNGASKTGLVISKKLVRYLLSGSATEAGGLVRLHAQITDARSGAQLGAADTSVKAPRFMAGEQLLAREMLEVVTKRGLCTVRK
jgi:hypothetical protein